MNRYILLIYIDDAHSFLQMLSANKHWNADNYAPTHYSVVPNYMDSIEIDATEEELLVLMLQYRLKVFMQLSRTHHYEI